MRICLIGSYPPRRCGIGTFAQNLGWAIQMAGDQKGIQVQLSVIALNDEDNYDYPEEVGLTISQHRITDYLEAAHYINQFADVCLLQHEFGIFGGEHGVYLLNLIGELRVPLVTTLHTILEAPDFVQAHILRTIARSSACLVVMSRRAIQMLEKIYDIPAGQIALIEHGVPEFDLPDRNEIRQRLGFGAKKVLLTFGLLGRGKGIETVIHALPQVVEQHPELEYLVLGKTHPNVLRHEGESYRDSLRELAAGYGVEDHLVFEDNYVDERSLMEYLSAIDLYILPYLSEAQITSGTLSYAIGAGAAVVSTPFWHAQELLSGDRGRFFDFKNPEQLAGVIIELLNDPGQLEKMRRRAAAYGRKLGWRQIGANYLNLLREVAGQRPAAYDYRTDYNHLPELKLDHLLLLTDSTGIIQHAKYAVPNFKEGYCLDDNARALMAATMARKLERSGAAARLIPIYLAYIFYMQREDGWFRNFLGYDRRFLDDIGSEDAFGRTIWALGHFLANSQSDGHFLLAEEMFFKAFPLFEKVGSPRAQANIILGLCQYLRRYHDHEESLTWLRVLAKKLESQFAAHYCNNWQWFEEVLAYDNGLLPLALFSATEHLQDADLEEIASSSLRFLETLVLSGNRLRLLGCHEIYRRETEPCYFDQQPLDAMIMVLLYLQIYRLRGSEEDKKKAFLCFDWFLGRNDLWIPLYNPATGGCHDGLMETGLNRNQGAESTLSYLIARLALQEMQMEEIRQRVKNDIAADSQVGGR